MLFVLKTLGISQERYDSVVKSRLNPGVPSTEKRGKHWTNKIPESTIEKVKRTH